MFACGPPLLHSGVGKIVADRSFDLTPQSFVQGAIAIVEEHPFAIPGKPCEERTKSELGDRVQALEGAYPVKKDSREVSAFLSRFDKITPLRGQDIDSSAAALLVLLSDLDRKVNQRGNYTNRRHQLADCGEHFPIHRRIQV